MTVTFIFNDPRSALLEVLSAADELRAQLEVTKEHLGEAEHDGGTEQRRRHGWRYAKTRYDSRKLHPAMVPYAELPEREKGKDRNSVRHYPELRRARRLQDRADRIGATAGFPANSLLLANRGLISLFWRQEIPLLGAQIPLLPGLGNSGTSL